ncbi:MAG TPA: prepilin-type N-terminal cleavage/methylation domain-containing protein [Nitrospira sp.]|nr:prepilin-type N-terminal cleavage/methylation domain-containing protein [Nitrospira sp.]
MHHESSIREPDCRSSVLSPPPSFHSSPSSAGFTLLEILIVLFLLGTVLALVIPRIVIGEDLSSTGRKFIGTIRSLQGMAAAIQKPVKLYLDIDRGTYWAMVVDGREEKRPLDATWATPLSLPESIRFTEISVGPAKWTYGRAELSFFPNGRINPATVYLADAGNGLLGLAVDPLTGRIRTSDQRFDLTRPRPIPDRVKVLLQASAR